MKQDWCAIEIKTGLKEGRGVFAKKCIRKIPHCVIMEGSKLLYSVVHTHAHMHTCTHAHMHAHTHAHLATAVEQLQSEGMFNSLLKM